MLWILTPDSVNFQLHSKISQYVNIIFKDMIQSSDKPSKVTIQELFFPVLGVKKILFEVSNKIKQE